jgi:hypothetical protein
MVLRHSLAILTCLVSAMGLANPAPFDLAGPSLQIRITRGAKTLPVAEVPHLAAGDRISVKTDLPPSQSANYLMIGAFLSGSTNPPPKSWFFRCETWKAPCARDGLTMTVPAGAQQVAVFLAPQTGGDFKTVMNTVRGRPGAFVRASQDLNQAALDRSRLEMYLAAIRAANAADPAQLKSVTPLLSRSLGIKADEKCLEKVPDLQAPCLMQGQESLILNDGHSASIVEALTSGPAGDLAMEASYTPQLGYGYYSPYFASVLDIARILDSFHTAQYQYIPALGSAHGASLNLALNAAPSFHNPMSVLVIGLPAVESSQPPPLHPVEPKQSYCASNSSLVLPVEGAPLAFSTGYAHDISLRIGGSDGVAVELPATADASRGGFEIDTSGLRGKTIERGARGTLHGFWGFDPYEGPSFLLTQAHAQTWELAPGDDAGLIVGRQNSIRLRAQDISCVDAVTVKDQNGNDLPIRWTAAAKNEIEIQLPLQEAKPGSFSLLVTQHGDRQPRSIPIEAYAEAGHLDQFVIHDGDSRGVLRGSRLDKVAGVSIHGIEFKLGQLSTRYGNDELILEADAAKSAPALKQGEPARASVTLQDGRTFQVPVVVEAPRPRVMLLSKNVQPSPVIIASNVQLADPGELPQDSRLTFALRAESPGGFTRDTSIQVASPDETTVATLSVAKGDVTLENREVAVATFDAAKTPGSASFGPLQFRVNTDGVASDWQPLATLVRLPILKDLKCPAAADAPCKLSGSNLFLIDSVSGNSTFDQPVRVPDGFLGAVLPVPHPSSGQIYVKLRDSPAGIHAVTLAAQELPAPQLVTDASGAANGSP